MGGDEGIVKLRIPEVVEPCQEVESDEKDQADLLHPFSTRAAGESYVNLSELP